MTGFIINRLLQAVVVMLAMSAIVFVGVYAIGNPIDVLISREAPQKVRAEIIAHYGLDQPLWRQYAHRGGGYGAVDGASWCVGSSLRIAPSRQRS
jgi:peptide/nickel transport system permease protein